MSADRPQVNAIGGNADSTTKYDSPGTGPMGVFPNLQQHNVVAIFDSMAAAEAAVDDLRAAGFGAEEISLVRRSEGDAPQVGAEHTRAEQGAATGASVGAVVGGAIGLTALAVTGIGAVLAAGPIVAILTGVLTGGALGGLVGSLAGLGIPSERAKRYEEAVRQGGVFMTVKTSGDEANRAVDILNRRGAREVESYTPAL